MKKQLLLLAALSLSVIGASAQGFWVPQATGFPNTSTGVFNVSVCDSATVWISAYDGSGGGADYRDYSMTIDGGATWIPGVIPAPATHAWSMIHGWDATTAWALMYNTAAAGGGVWKTTDGGVNWTQQGVGTVFMAGASFPNVVHFWDANTGFMMGDPVASDFELYTTTDGGTTWVPVPAANIPAPLAGEWGIVNHYEVVGNTIWFDTNKGRVYKSTDQGLNWTVSSTGITVPANGAIDIIFYDANNGFARLYDGTAGINTDVRRTTDGGATWTPGTVTGEMFGSDLSYVPGTASRIVSTGAATGFIGSSYSDDGGLNWTIIETDAQRTALGVWDINTMWAGGFTTSPSSDGIYKFENLTVIACGDPSISSGTTSALDSTICFGDTLFVSTTGAVSPSSVAVFGWSMIVSTGDISFNTDPLNQPGIIGGTGILFPVPNTISTTLPNDGSTGILPGVYYLTPVVYANAQGTGTNITGYVLDPTCTYTGQSMMVTLYNLGDPACFVGVNEINSTVMNLNTYQLNDNQVSVNLSSAKQSNVELNVFDLTGRLVISKGLTVSQGPNNFILDVATLGTGAYVIRVSDDNSVVTGKMVKY